MTPPYTHIACCVDGSPSDRRALTEARRLQLATGARLSIVHVRGRIPPAAFPAVVLSDAGATARGWLEAIATRYAATPVLLHGGHAPEGYAEAACRWARDVGAPDLIVAAPHRGRRARAVAGGFTRNLAEQAPCPVLLVGSGPAPPAPPRGSPGTAVAGNPRGGIRSDTDERRRASGEGRVDAIRRRP